MSHARWWHGRRGEWYVAVQAVLFLLVAVGPRIWPGLPAPAVPYPAVSLLAAVLMAAGLLLVVSGVVWLRSNLSPLPLPRQGATLVRGGPFRIVRHPMYAGAILAGVGWSLYVQGSLTLAWALLLFVLFDVKSRREELWLDERFPEYDAYRRRVRKLIPFVY